MSVAVVAQAKSMADFILAKAHRGPGDTVDAAMHRAAKDFKAPEKWLHRLRYRWRTLRDIPGSALLELATAYQAASEATNELYEQERGFHDANTALVRLADIVAGRKDEGETSR